VPRLDWWPEDEPGDCPGPETVAAFIDGRLGADERSLVARHVSGCAACYEVFAGTVDFQRADEAALRSRPSVAWLAIAAALAIAVIGGLVVRGWRSALPEPGSYLASLSGLAAPTDAPPWPVVVFRGPAAEAPPAKAFEIGVLLVDGHALASRGDAAAAQPRFARLAELMDAAGFLGPQADLCREASRASPETIGSYAPRLVTLAQDLGDRFDRRELVLGSWAEAGRRAALARHAPFFEDPRQRAILDSALSRGGLGADADAAVKNVGDRWPKGHAAPDWPRLAEAFDALVQAKVR
jgi:Putative zinc-finger